MLFSWFSVRPEVRTILKSIDDDLNDPDSENWNLNLLNDGILANREIMVVIWDGPFLLGMSQIRRETRGMLSTETIQHLRLVEWWEMKKRFRLMKGKREIKLIESTVQLIDAQTAKKMKPEDLPSGILSVDRKMTPGEKERVLEEWEQFRKSGRAVQDVIVLEGGATWEPLPSRELKVGVYRKMVGKTGIGRLYQFLLLARSHTAGVELVVYIPLYTLPEWAGTVRPCVIERTDWERKFQWVGEGLPKVDEVEDKDGAPEMPTGGLL